MTTATATAAVKLLGAGARIGGAEEGEEQTEEEKCVREKNC